jgi:hypothetical protein
VVLLALAALQMFHTSGVAGSGTVTTVSHKVVLLALVVSQMCNTSGVAGSGTVTTV